MIINSEDEANICCIYETNGGSTYGSNETVTG